MEGDISGIRIIPSSLEFFDSEVDVVHRQTVTVKNVSKSSKSIRFYGPKTKNFSLKVNNPEKPVAPGLQVQAFVEYETSEEADCVDRLVVTVDGDVIEIPLHAYPCQPILTIQGPVNFGNVVACSKVISKEISVINQGSKSGEFKVKYSGDIPISVIPSSGNVPPKTAQIIKVEFVTKESGKIDEEAKVYLEGQETTALRILGNVVERTLELLSPQNEELMECIKFGNAYYGTDRTEAAILFNNGPEPVNFVAVLQDDAPGQDVGTDLTKTTAATLSDQLRPDQYKGFNNPLTSLVTAIPNQGTLAPYEKIPVFFRFSPRWNSSKSGWKCQGDQPPRQDFALFMHLEMIGSSNGFQNKSGNKTRSNIEGSFLEVAVTGTALPVQLNFSPQTKLDFDECPVGEHVDTLCMIKNESAVLPALFQFRRIAHFSMRPPNGTLPPGGSQEILFSFTPNQVGTFKPNLTMDVIGQVADNRNPFMSHLEVIHSMNIQLQGRSDPVTVKRAPKFNPGITPKITNEVGQFVDTTFETAEKKPRAAILNSLGTEIHKIESAKNVKTWNDAALVSFPNDRAKSIRPSDRKENYKTIFTGMERHTYVDPDYAYTDGEEAARKLHKKYYQSFIGDRRENRINKLKAKEFEETNNKTDIGIKTAAGIKPKKLTQDEIKPDPRPPTPPNAGFRLLSSKELSEAEETTMQKNVQDGLNAIPTTDREKRECSRILSPQELHQVVIGPPTLEFDDVCLRSVSTKNVNIVNNLNQYIHVVFDVDCRELRQTSPLSQVIPPQSKATLPIIFESNIKGLFQRSLMYTVNSAYRHHVTVLANVVPVHLSLDKDELEVFPSPGQPAEAGYRGVVTLKNPLNYPAEFTWAPILGERGTAFSIRPATGVVDAFQDLQCEIVFHPSYLAPEDGMFALQVHGGNQLALKCSAKFGPTTVKFIDRRIMFGQVPLHLTTIKAAHLHNNSQNHAYFEVIEPNPFPGMTISPVHGVVPVGGNAELKVSLTPNAVIKFDTRVMVSIRGWKIIELRMGGTVEPPVIDIDEKTFNLGGVFCGSQKTTTFNIINKTTTKTKMEFDLSRYSDFSLAFPGRETADDYTFQLLNPGVYSVTIKGEESIPCELTFCPTEVASYDFNLPVVINQTVAPSPSPTPFPPTPAPSNKNSIAHIINPRPVHVSISTPRRKVIATALREPLQLSHQRIEFSLPVNYLEIAATSGIGTSKGTLLVNNSDKRIKWSIDLSKANKTLEDGIFKFLHSSGMPYLTHGFGGVEGHLEPGITTQLGVAFCPKGPGTYYSKVPVIINDMYTNPYVYLELTGYLKAPKIWFDPLAIVLTPVPLCTTVSAEFNILTANYSKVSHLGVEYPEVECEDGSKITPLTVSFPNGNEIKPCCSDDGQIEPYLVSCKVSFSSTKPVSFCQPLKLVDDQGNSATIAITATADNCLLTCYPFIAQHRGDHHIICEQGLTLRGRKAASKESLNAGEAIFVPCTSPQPSRPSTSATSTGDFQVSSSSYEDSQSVTESTYPSTPRDGALVKLLTSSADHDSQGRNNIQSRSLGSALFPDEDSEEGIFHTEVLLAVQRWFSSHGWPGGSFPITIPYALRSGLGMKNGDEGSKKANNKKEMKTIYDMIGNLLGKPPPGIPLNSPLPADDNERVKQVYWQHSTLLTFLKSQGACVSSIKPEYLMEPYDYKVWLGVQRETEKEKNKDGLIDTSVLTSEEQEIEDQLFEAVSKRAWTDILLQILKTLVFSKITPRQFKNLSFPDRTISSPNLNPDPLCSNVYSVQERILLSWLNHNYEHFRQRIWEDSDKGGVPPSRWIVNFDYDLLDGLVLAAVLGAHCPFLISDLKDMYTHPSTAEQCLHNALKVSNSMKYIGIEYDIQAIDITDPNPIALILLCVHLYQRMPQYIPKTSVEFTGALHSSVMRQVRLSNPSGKSLIYHALIAGHDARDFDLPKGREVTVPPRGHLNMSVEFTSRYLRPAEAVLLMVGRRSGSALGTTLVFNLKTMIDSITPKHTLKFDSHCYELHKINLEVTNPFAEPGTFRVVLVEGAMDNPVAGGSGAPFSKSTEKKLKNVRSRTDHGQKRPKTPPSPKSQEVFPYEKSPMLSKKEDSPAMKSFHAPQSQIELDGNGTGTLEVHFLPFNTGKRQCSIIFISDETGEFLYSIEAMSLLPKACSLPFRSSGHSFRISSAAAAGSGRGQYGGDDSIVYWKCEVNQTLDETINVPISNAVREKALLLASQQFMTESELHRRLVTGTLSSTTLTTKTMSMLSVKPGPGKKTSKKKDSDAKSMNFKVEVDSKYFKGPETIQMPVAKSVDDLDHNKTIEIPITFKSDQPGHYPCNVILRAQDDIRIYKIECTVVPEGNQAKIEFRSPVHQTVTQQIPIGKLDLINVADGTAHNFDLVGKAKKPLALETIKLECVAKEKISQRLNVPNITRKKLHYRVESDLDFVGGDAHLTVWPGQSAFYTMIVAPRRRGTYKGVISFIAGRNPIVEVDSDGDEIPELDEDKVVDDNYRVWFALEVTVKPSPPEKTLEITCACQKRVILEVGVNNPIEKELTLDVTIEGMNLTGRKVVTLSPRGRATYELTFAPAIIGKCHGSLVFYHELTGEFWYELVLIAEPPIPITLADMECELGRWSRQLIELKNPTSETLELVSTISNMNNFNLEKDNEQPIILRPHENIKMPLNFMPSMLGEGDQQAVVTFLCEQLGEWIFHVAGRGLVPQPQDPVSIYAEAASNTTIIIPFRNPLDVPIIIDVSLLDKDQQNDIVFNNELREESPFCLLLKQKQEIRVGPKSTLDIPVSFAPDEMRLYEAVCSLAVRRADGRSWQYVAGIDDDERPLPRTESGGVKELTWLYPINGIPEANPVKDNQAALIECPSRERAEERLEVVLSGVAPCSSGPQRGIKTRAVTPKDQASKPPDGIVVAETISVTNEFTFEIVFSKEENTNNLQNAVALSLVRQHRDKVSGLVVLVFNIVFAPNTPMRHDVQLLVKAATGGVWRFPVRFVATEPKPDDTIVIEAVGLNKEVALGFRLNSQESHPIPFRAFYVAGSDPELTVSPMCGELLPSGSNGTLITVGFTPAMYGKAYHGRLVVQTQDMQWTYIVKGIPPGYIAPEGRSTPPMKGPHPDPRRRSERYHFIRENLKLNTTAVSSPIKGALLLPVRPRNC
ncbi:cilia- and flagella-associated protein 47-like isoform X2 [Lineus longissimus]|uniref:cilia- and flagella-associated protein 47-like isoform X2 n=1 Tax=Lineus longissimus TaxID=88925 RepID=UPI00315D57EB